MKTITHKDHMNFITHERWEKKVARITLALSIAVVLIVLFETNSGLGDYINAAIADATDYVINYVTTSFALLTCY